MKRHPQSAEMKAILSPEMTVAGVAGNDGEACRGYAMHELPYDLQ